MTDQEWDDLTRYRRPPKEAREPIEAELNLYSRFASAVAQPPSDTRKNLEHAAELASRLLKAISAFGPDEHHALVEFVSATPRLDALGRQGRRARSPRQPREGVGIGLSDGIAQTPVWATDRFQYPDHRDLD